jgi:DNA-directed RNA polymerase specialized sigma24 family protein
MAADRSAAELERFLAERADHLLRTAVLLTGSREAGEDLLQTAVERLLRRWRGFDGDPSGYLRRTLCNLAIGNRARMPFRKNNRFQSRCCSGWDCPASVRLSVRCLGP